MEPRCLVATAWNNGSHRKTGAGYGLKIPAKDRDQFFDRNWKFVTLRLMANGEECIAKVNVTKKSFWDSKCRELIKKEIGQWLIGCGLEPWPKGSPPKFTLIPTGKARFDVKRIERRACAGPL